MRRLRRSITADFSCLPALIATLGLIAAPDASGGTLQNPPSQAARPPVPGEKETTLGLYVTAKEAYERWKADPAGVKILDVRTTEEYLFVGHAAMAWNIPLLLPMQADREAPAEPLLMPSSRSRISK